MRALRGNVLCKGSLFFGVHIQKKFCLLERDWDPDLSAPVSPCVLCTVVLICVTCLSDLNSAESLSFLLPVPSELKSMLAKMLLLLTRISICCLESLWLCLLWQKWSLLSHAHGAKRTQSKKEKRQAVWKSASAFKPAAAALNLTGPHSTECITMFLQPRSWVPSNALRHKVTNVCRVLCIFSLTPTPTHTCTDCVTSEKTKPVKAGYLKDE